MFDNYNRHKFTDKTTSHFLCDDADEEYWDLLKHTGGYSPRNEVYRHAGQFVDMWNKLMGDSVQPSGKLSEA